MILFVFNTTYRIYDPSIFYASWRRSYGMDRESHSSKPSVASFSYLLFVNNKCNFHFIYMMCFHMFPQRTRIRISFNASVDFAVIWLRVTVRSILMFCSIRSVTEGLSTAYKFAFVGFLAGVSSQMRLQVLSPRIAFVAVDVLYGWIQSHVLVL